MKMDTVCQNQTENEKHNILITAAFRAMLDNTGDMVFIKNRDLVYVAASMPFVKMVGKENPEEIIGHTDLEIFEDENLAKRYVADDHKLIQGGVDLIDYVEPITEDDGQPRYGSTSKYILADANGQTIGILGITKDITREYLAKQHYQQELKYLFELPKNAYAVTYIDVDDWRIINQRRQTLNKGSYKASHTPEKLCETELEAILETNSKGTEFYRNFTQKHLRNLYMKGKNSIIFKYRRCLSDQSVRWIRNEIRFMVDAESGHLCVVISAKDIDAQKQKELNLMMAAKMDKMTMLLNRETTMENIRRTLKKKKEQSHALFMIDVDNFKVLNDTLGHQTGDAFLIRLAAELKGTFEEQDIVGRIGGDEFFALMKEVSDREMVEKKAQMLLDKMQNVCSVYPDIPLSGSIGISMYPEDADALEILYEKADEALYDAKRSGKNRYVFSKEKENTI